jgi:hypothetical protein
MRKQEVHALRITHYVSHIMNAMSSRQRVEAALRHQEPDRTPVFEYVLLSPLADFFLGRVYGGDPANWEALRREKGWEGAVRQSAVDQLELALRLGQDMMYVLPNPAELPAPASGQGQESNDPVERMLRRNEQARAVPPVSEDIFLIYAFLKQEMDRRGADLPILAPAYVHGVWTDVDLMQTMLLAPEVAHAHFTLATERALELIEHYISLGVHQVGVGGDFAGTRPIISPMAYRTFIMPQVYCLAYTLHTAGLWAVNASDGDLWPVIDDFLLGCQVDAYLEIDLHAGMDLRRLKDLYGRRITFFGNLDCGIELSFGTTEVVRQHTLDCLEAGQGGGGHILCASNAITASVPVENYLAVLNAYREFFHLPMFEHS